jgi:streptogramin lyase
VFGQVYFHARSLYLTTCTGYIYVLNPIHEGFPQLLLTGLGHGPTVSSNGIAVDSKGDAFFTDYWNSVGELPAGSSTPVTIATAGGTHYCVAVGSNGKVFYTDNMGGTV